ncbi:MAG: 2-oxo-4-hydroxy-4-carboxy-5-ureidoimidazoline decarboxylase [Ignavibacteriae bacterium]|nr:2-oxo-4-hydroxy-4-carboxy-5-ureidoimidazoline decarboxylase [Ignavibacteriota bacterium]
MTIDELNNSDRFEVLNFFLQCCGCTKWIELMASSRPFLDKQDILEKSEMYWNSIEYFHRMEAFLHHPKIGDIKSLKKKYSGSKLLSESEQSGVNSASEETLRLLSDLNTEYEKKFGFIFIVCATGKSAEEMIFLLLDRIGNSYEKEIEIAMSEQNKITKLRLEKFL